jgi:voltage-gated potassium channel
LIVFARRFVAALAILLLLSAIGTVGYVLIEGWAIGDALYMAAITLTAVGYSEVHPLTEAGRTFTMILLVGGLSWMGLWFALITSFIVEFDLTPVFRRRRMTRAIKDLDNHVIVCGAGRTGRQVAHELDALHADWVAIDRNPERVELLRQAHPDALVMEGDATHDDTLLQAGLESARGLVACLSADTDNLFVCLSARDLKPDLTIVARAYEGLRGGDGRQALPGGRNPCREPQRQRGHTDGLRPVAAFGGVVPGRRDALLTHVPANGAGPHR